MLKTKFENNVLTAFIEGELDHDSAARIRTKLDGICESIKPKLLNLDFSGVSLWTAQESVLYSEDTAR